MSEKAKLIASAQKYLQKGQLAKALKDYERIVEIDPKDIRNRQKLAELFVRAKDNGRALEQYAAVAKYYADNGFYLKAIAVYKQMQRSNPDEPEYYRRLAELNEKQGLIGNAQKEYHALVEHYEKEQNLVEVIGILQKMRGLEADNLNIIIKLAQVYAKTGQTEESLELFQEVCKTVAGRKEYQKVLRLCDMFAPFFKHSSEIDFEKARAKIHLGETTEGIRILNQLLSSSGDDPPLLQLLASAQHQEQDFAAERRTLVRLLNLQTDNTDVQQRYIDACLQSGQFVDALQVLGTYRDGLVAAGRAAFVTGAYRTLREKLPDNPQVLAGLEAAPADDESLLGGELDAGDEVLEELEELEEIEEVDSVEEIAGEDYAADQEPVVEAGPAVTDAGADEVPLGFLEELEFELDSAELEPADEAAPDLEPEPVEPAPVAKQAPAVVAPEEEQEYELELELDGDEISDMLDGFGGTQATTPEESEAASLEVGGESIGAGLAAALDEVDFYLQQGLYDEAENLCQGMLLEHPGNPDVAAKLDQVAGLKEESPSTAAADKSPELTWEEALAGLLGNEPFEIAAEDAESHYNLGIAYKEMGLLDDAIGEFSQAMRHPERLVDCLLLKGLCLVEKRDFAEAERLFKLGLLDPHLEEAERKSLLFELGLAAEAKGAPAEALDYYLQVSALDGFFRDVGDRIVAMRHLADTGEAGEPQAQAKGRTRVSYL